MKNTVILFGAAWALAVSACKPRDFNTSISDTNAASRTQRRGRITITAQKPGDITIMSKGSLPLYRDASGHNVQAFLKKTDDFTYISLRVATADGLLAWASGKALRDILLVPRYDVQEAAIDVARAENWTIKSVVLDANNYITVSFNRDKAIVYCPMAITYEKKDKTLYTSTFPSDMCKNVEAE